MAESIEMKESLDGTKAVEATHATSGGELREFEKLDSLLCQIPRKAQHGILMSCDLVLTCIDANSLFIALGSNVGVTFLYSRKDHSVQRLRSTNTSDVVTCVRLHHGIDDQLAVGTACGDVTVYGIPGITSVQKKQPLPEASLFTMPYTLQKFDVRDVHKHYITCLEWSTNGMKLFSGDKGGQVATTEVDLYEGKCKSSPLLIESSTEIVQLDYRHKVLLVSTRKRSFVVRLDQKSQLINIGTQERKVPGPFGACFIPGLCKTDDAKLCAARPGCRLWLSDMNGVVQNTYIFTEPLAASVPEISLLSAGKLQIGSSDFQFGNLKWFRQREVITWSNSALVVLDPQDSRVVACQGRLNGIVDVAVVEDTGEIFLLRRHADARVIRIADKAEAPSGKDEAVMPHLPLTAAEKTTVKTEEKETSSKSNFFSKLSSPLKLLEKNLNHDKKPAPERQAPTKSVPDIVSPGLPPVVRLASPDLEGVRIFTTGSSETPSTTSSSQAQYTTVASTTSGSSEVPTAVSLSQSPVASATSDSGVSVDHTFTSPYSHSTPESHHTQAHHLLGESSAQTLDTEEDSIVFSHRMRKPKKHRHKRGSSLSVKKKDEDSISQQSISSQQSADLTLSRVSSTTSSADDSAMEALRHADDVLKMVDNILKGDNRTKDNNSSTTDTSRSKDACDQSHQPVVGIHHTVTTSPIISVENSEHESGASMFTEVIRNYSVALPSINQPCEDNFVSRVTDVPSLGSLGESEQARAKPVETEEEQENEHGNNESQMDSLKSNVLSESDQHTGVTKDHTDFTIDIPRSDKKSLQDILDIVDHAMASSNKMKKSSDEMDAQHEENSWQLPSETVKEKKDIPYHEVFQDVYSEIEAIEASKPFRRKYKREKSADDFYSAFQDFSPETPETPNPERIFHWNPVPPEAERSTEMQDIMNRRLVNTWSEFTTPANIYSLVVSVNHIWFTDKSENIYYSSLGSPKGIVWRKASGNANQISVSPNGQIVWRLHRGVVFAGTKISTRHPEGLKWVEAVRDVETISVDDTCAWYIKKNGDVMMQRGLSLERPCYKSKKVDCHHKLKHIVCRHGTVWAITEGLKLLVRQGICSEVPEGEEWELDYRDTSPYLFSHVAIDNENIGWTLDVLGQIWFCDGVTPQNPLGRRQWWQIPMGEYILQDETTMDMIRAVARKFDPTKLSYILSTNRGGLITAGSQGVWLALDFRNVLQVCRGSVQGYQWVESHPVHMASSSTWKHICASAAHLDWGLVWAQHTNGDIYTFQRERGEAAMISDTFELCCISVGPMATWALTVDGDVMIRAGMGPHCPQGSSWVSLDLSQLGEAHLVHLSCNSLYVWAVEEEGTVYQRIGAKPPAADNLSPVWLPIDTFADIIFTKVHTGPLDWMVWAIDNRRLTYVRVGITENMPIGQEWVHVPGIQAMDLALTKTGVWALTPNGEIFFRYGISRERPCGNYWKKMPGTFMKISASADDELWGINTEGQLMRCSVKYLMRNQDSSDPLLQRTVSISSSISEDVDWEIV